MARDGRDLMAGRVCAGQEERDQNERDYAALQAAVKEGEAEATTDI